MSNFPHAEKDRFDIFLVDALSLSPIKDTGENIIKINELMLHPLNLIWTDRWLKVANVSQLKQTLMCIILIKVRLIITTITTGDFLLLCEALHCPPGILHVSLTTVNYSCSHDTTERKHDFWQDWH